MGLSLVIIERGILAETANEDYYARCISDLMERRNTAYMRKQKLKKQRRWILVKRFFAEKFNMRQNQ